MTEHRIWTAQHTIRVAAPPKRVFELVANVDRWPTLFDSIVSVEHLGFDGVCERVRFQRTVGGEVLTWTSVRELNPKRLQVRFRQIGVSAPLASLGGLWLVAPQGLGSAVALDHYYRVTDDSPLTAARVERDITAISMSMLTTLRKTAERAMADLIKSCSDRVTTEGDMAS
jgi:aromatase